MSGLIFNGLLGSFKDTMKRFADLCLQPLNKKPKLDNPEMTQVQSFHASPNTSHQPSVENAGTNVSVRSFSGDVDDCSQIITLAEVGTFNQTSMNCIHFTYLNYFYKVQIKQGADSLVDEILHTKCVNILENQKGQRLFPKYGGCTQFVENEINKNSNDAADFVLALKLELLQGQSLYAYVQKHTTSLHAVLAKEIESFYNFEEFYCMSHNDLHLNNIIVVDGFKPQFKFIDLGRCYFQGDNNIKNLRTLPGNQNIIEIEKKSEFIKVDTNNKFAITENGWLCDLATLTINLCPMFYFDYPSWFQMKFQYVDFGGFGSDVLYLNVNLTNYVKGDEKTNVFNKGLLWFACCLHAFFPVTVREEGTSYKFFPINLPLQHLQNYELLYPNGCFKKEAYEKIASKAHAYYQFIISTTGGKRKAKTKTTHKKNTYVGGDDETKHSILDDYIIEEMKKGKRIKEDILDSYLIPRAVSCSIYDELKNNKYYFNGVNMADVNTFVDMEISISINDTWTTINYEDLGKRHLQGYGLKIIYNDGITNDDIKNQLKQQAEKMVDRTKAMLAPTQLFVKTNFSGVTPKPPNTSAQLKELYGAARKTYKLCIDRETKRKYVRKNNSRWYLDENRGKYSYVDQSKKNVFIKAKPTQKKSTNRTVQRKN